MPFDGDRGASGTDAASALTARVDAIDAFLTTTKEIVDEKSLKELRRTIEALSKRDPKFEERVLKDVAVLADRIETVAKTVSISSAALAAKDGEIVQLRREVEARLSGVDTSLQGASRGTDPAELLDIRRALDDLSKVTKQRMPRGLEGRIDELAGKLTLLAQRVDSLSTTVSTTAAGLSGREGDLNALRRAFDAEGERTGGELAELRRATDPRAIADVRQELKELADETASKQHANRQLLGQAANKVDALSERLDSLTSSLTSTSGRVSATEQNLSALRSYLEDSGSKVHGLLAEHRQGLTTLFTRTAALEQAESETTRVLEERISAASDRVDDLGQRLDPLAVAVASTTERLDARDVALETLEGRFHDASARVDGLVAELTHALTELPDPSTLAQELTPRIDELGERTTWLTDQLVRVESSVDEQRRASSSASVTLERLVAEERGTTAEVSGRLDSLASRLSGADEQLAALHTHVEEAGGHLGSLISEQKTLLAALNVRTASLEQGDGAATRVMDERVADVRHELDELARSLESLDTSTRSAAVRVSGTEETLSELRAYVESAGGRLGSLLAEHKQLLAQQSDSLTALGARTAALEQAETGTAGMLEERVSSSSDRIDQVAGQVDALAANVESAVTSFGEKEHEVAALHRSFSESSSRIETIAEDIRDALAALPDDSPDALEALTSRLDSTAAGVNSLTGRLDRLEAVQVDQVAVELTERFDRIDLRIAAVAAEMGRAKTLWPVALRSLEARLDDLVARAHAHEAVASEAPDADEPPAEDETDDLLAGLRNSLKAMDGVAEEMARASEAWATDGDHQAEWTQPSQDSQQATTGGARIAPLQVSDP